MLAPDTSRRWILDPTRPLDKPSFKATQLLRAAILVPELVPAGAIFDDVAWSTPIVRRHECKARLYGSTAFGEAVLYAVDHEHLQRWLDLVGVGAMFLDRAKAAMGDAA